MSDSNGKSANAIQHVEEILEREFGDRVYSVEDGVVWISGMNSGCPTIARRMSDMLVSHDIPCGLVYDDGASRFGGVQFNYYV